MIGKLKTLQTAQININHASLGTLHKIDVLKGSEFVGCTLHEYKHVRVSFAYLQPSLSSSKELDASEWECHRYLIISNGHQMPYVNYRHVASLSVGVVSESVVSRDKYTTLEMHVFEIIHPQKIGDDCQEPCEWDDDDE